MNVQIIEYWKAQNTGWSGGSSWFDSGGSPANPMRFKSEDETREFIKRNRWDDASVKWRLVHTQIERLPNKQITTEEWVNVA